MLLDSQPVATINVEETTHEDADLLSSEEEEPSDHDQGLLTSSSSVTRLVAEAGAATPLKTGHFADSATGSEGNSARGAHHRHLIDYHHHHPYQSGKNETQQTGSNWLTMNKTGMTLNVDPATKPLYAITPTDSVASMEESSVASPSGDHTAISMHESNSTTALQPDAGGNKKNQDSSESLLSQTRKEKWLTILLQVCPPYLIAGLGMVAAGIMLDTVKEWKVFQDIPEFLVLVTPLLGLKGNLEMTLASRLSTHANLGTMESGNNKWRICTGNLCLIQVQAIVVGFLASIVAIIIGVVIPSDKHYVYTHAILLCASSLLTAAVASFVLGVLMVFVILFSKRLNLNPDNIATPIAASLGDVTTLGLLSCFASWLYDDMKDPWVCPIIIGIFVVATPVWAYVTHKNEFTREVLVTGWPPVIMAMLISSGGGFILDKAEARFSQLALYQPVINGVGGNLVSVQASRISTALHRDSSPGHVPGKLPGVPGSVLKSPVSVFMGSGVDSVAARVLLGIVIPGHLIFTTVIHFVSSDANFSAPFMVFYLTAAVIQVALLLYMAQILVRFFWYQKQDPDTNAIPYLTAFGDLIGTALLYAAFAIVEHLGCLKEQQQAH